MKDLKVVKELNIFTDYKEIKKIYNKGNKLAVLFNVKTLIGFLGAIVEEEDEEVKESYCNDVIDSLLMTGDLYGIFIKPNKYVVIDSIVENSWGANAVIKPFKSSDKTMQFTLYSEDGYIAHKVVEIEG